MEPTVCIAKEREQSDGWSFDAGITTDAGQSHHELFLNYADYNYFCPDGTLPPSRVAEAVLAFFARHAQLIHLQERLDASVPRRRMLHADRDIREILGQLAE
ncbi:MAG: hypothetical protein EXS10_10300 [Phycisphaerales bacterium]|nr:hypothetical protein [Phycisphaerales bacterium]